MDLRPSTFDRVFSPGRFVFVALLTFLRKPCLSSDKLSLPVSTPALLLWLLIFAFGATAIAGLLALPLVVGSDVAVGRHLNQVLDGPAWGVFVALIVLGPLVEEMIFRGWLTGTYRAIGGTVLFLAMFYGAAWGWEVTGQGKLGLEAQLGISAVALLMFTLVQISGQPARPPGYGALFPYLFWLQGLIFGGLHFANLGGPSLALPLLIAASLVICGWLFAYARIVAGLGVAYLLHALYNLPVAAGAILLPMLLG